MKKKRIIKGVAIIILLLSMLSLFGCASTKEQIKKDNAKVLEFLNKKYNKEFKISEEIHEVNSPTGGIAQLRQGLAYCIDNPDEIFKVYIDSSNNEFYGDTYQNITIRPYAQEYYEKIIKESWDVCKVWVELTCFATKDEVYSKDNYETFLTSDGGSVSATIFIKSVVDNNENEAEDIYQLSKRIKESGLKGTFYYYYLNDNLEIDSKEMKNRKTLIKDYINRGSVLRFCKIYINDRENLNIEDIKKELDAKDF